MQAVRPLQWILHYVTRIGLLFLTYVLRIQFPARTRVLVVAEGECLAVVSIGGNGMMSLPGGGSHRGERFADAAVREVFEETGVAIETHQLRPLNYYAGQTIMKPFDVGCYVAELPKKIPVRASFEVIYAKWLPLDSVADDVYCSELLKRSAKEYLAKNNLAPNRKK